MALSWSRVGGLSMAFLVFHRCGRVCVGMGRAGFPVRVGQREREWCCKGDKLLLPLPLHV